MLKSHVEGLSVPNSVPQYNLGSFCRAPKVRHGPSLVPIANFCSDNLMGVLEPIFCPHVLLFFLTQQFKYPPHPSEVLPLAVYMRMSQARPLSFYMSLCCWGVIL